MFADLCSEVSWLAVRSLLDGHFFINSWVRFRQQCLHEFMQPNRRVQERCVQFEKDHMRWTACTKPTPRN